MFDSFLCRASPSVESVLPPGVFSESSEADPLKDTVLSLSPGPPPALLVADPSPELPDQIFLTSKMKYICYNKYKHAFKIK